MDLQSLYILNIQPRQGQIIDQGSDENKVEDLLADVHFQTHQHSQNKIEHAIDFFADGSKRLETLQVQYFLSSNEQRLPPYGFVVHYQKFPDLENWEFMQGESQNIVKHYLSWGERVFLDEIIINPVWKKLLDELFTSKKPLSQQILKRLVVQYPDRNVCELFLKGYYQYIEEKKQAPTFPPLYQISFIQSLARMNHKQ